MRSILLIALAAVSLFTSPALAGTVPFRLDSFSSCQEQQPDVAALPGGGFVTVWQQGVEDDNLSPQRIFARLFGPDGTPLALEFLVNGNQIGYIPQVAANAAGQFLVAWQDGSSRIRGRVYGPTGAILGPERTLSSSGNGFALTATNDGDFALVTAHGDYVTLSRLGFLGQPVGVAQVLSSVTYPFGIPGYREPAVAAYGPSGVVVAWAFDDLDLSYIDAIAVTEDGEIEVLDLGVAPRPVWEDESERSQVAVAANAAGQTLVTWTVQAAPGTAGALRARVFGADRQPVGPILDLPIPSAERLSPPSAVAGPSGDFLVAWQLVTPQSSPSQGMLARVGSDGQLEGPAFQAWNAHSLARPALALDADGEALVAWQDGDDYEGAVCFSSGLYARRLAVSPAVLLLRDRFEVRVHWTDHAGSSGEGHAAPLTSDSGTFWFFDDDNLELIVKVLDGRAVNGNYWVFYGSLSDVAFTVEVTDTVTGQTRTYENPAGQLASRADTVAFPGAFPETAAATAAISSVAARSHVPDESGGTGPCTPGELSVGRRPGLCLGNRFEVEVAWHASGGQGQGQGVPLTADSGYLWFFDDDNLELMVKVLDGRAVNGRFWVFYGALTDVEYTVLVRDTVTGQVKTYHNPAGQLRSRADTAAF